MNGKKTHNTHNMSENDRRRALQRGTKINMSHHGNNSLLLKFIDRGVQNYQTSGSHGTPFAHLAFSPSSTTSSHFVVRKIRTHLDLLSLKKNQSTPRPSEHPPVMGGEMSKRLGGIKGCKYKTSSWHLNRFPDADNIGSRIQRIGCQPEKTVFSCGGRSRSWSAEQRKENKR